MGNWSCLYHWFECPSPLVAHEVYARLGCAADYAWTDDSWALRFGYLSPTLIQAVSSQKWGLCVALAEFVTRGCEGVVITQAGSEREDFFRVIGEPRVFSCRWNYVICLHAPASLPAKLVEASAWQLHLESTSLATILRAPRLHRAMPQFFHGQPRSTMMRRLAECAASATRESVRLVFGHSSPEHGHIHFGVLQVNDWLPGATYETSGSFNRLHGEQLLGPYVVPLCDEAREPILFDEREPVIDIEPGADLSLRTALVAADPLIRHAALERARRLRAPLAVEIARAVADPVAEVRDAAGRALRSGSSEELATATLPGGWMAFLHECMANSSWLVRMMAAERLAELGDESSLAILYRVVSGGARDADWEVRRAAVLAIAGIALRSHGDRAVIHDELCGAAGDAHEMVRAAALSALSRLGGRFSSLETVYLRALHDPVRRVWSQAASAIARHDDAPAERIGALLADDRGHVRRAAAGTLAAMGVRAAPALPAMCRALGHPDDDTRAMVVHALHALGPAAAPAVPALRAALGIAPSTELLRALGNIGTGEAMDILIALLDHHDSSITAWAAHYLGTLGPRAATAAAAIAAKLPHPHHVVRTSALHALVAIGAPVVDVDVIIRALLGDDHVNVRVAAARAVSLLHHDQAAAMQALGTSLDDETPRVAVHAALLLAARGRDALWVMHAGLGSRHGEAVVILARALMRMGAHAGAALMGLMRGLAHDTRAVREACADAIGAIGAPARSAVPKLRNLAAAGDVWQASWAVGRLHGVSDRAGLRALVDSSHAHAHPIEERVAAALGSGLLDHRFLHCFALACATRTARLVSLTDEQEEPGTRLLEGKRRWLEHGDHGALARIHEQAVAEAEQWEERWSSSQSNVFDSLRLARALAISAATSPDAPHAALAAAHAALFATQVSCGSDYLDEPDARPSEAHAQLEAIRQQLDRAPRS